MKKYATLILTMVIGLSPIYSQNSNFVTSSGASKAVNDLTNLNYPIALDPIGGAINNNVLIAKYSSNISATTRAALRNDVAHIVQVDTCMCSIPIERWIFPNGIDLNEKRKYARERPELESVDFEHYVYYEDWENRGASQNFSKLTHLPNQSSGDLTIAILDSGVDFEHPDLSDYIWSNNTETTLGFNGGDDDSNCLVDDMIGWDFVNDDNNPMDDHGHGTHVAGIIAEGLPECSNIKIMPLKTHDQNGYGTTFSIVCALYYAAQKGAKVANASWGYYGEESILIRNAIEFFTNTNDALFINSAGNEGVDISIEPHYPSSWTIDPMIVVGAINYENELWSDSNISPIHVDIMAYGVDIRSTLPSWYGVTHGIKTGTSMAAPIVSAACSNLFNSLPTVNNLETKHHLLLEAIFVPDLVGTNFVDGKFPFKDTNIKLKLFLEGPFDSGTNNMNDNIRTLGFIPILSPYDNSTSVVSSVLATTGSLAPVDWIKIEIQSMCGTTVYNKSCLVTRNGTVIQGDGSQDIKLPILEGHYDLIIRHRNHLDIVSDSKLLLEHTGISYDFSDASSPLNLGGTSAMRVEGSSLLMLSGDANQDGVVNAFDKNLFWAIQNGTTGYLEADFNLDGTVNAIDKNQYWTPNNSKISLAP